MRNFCKFIFSLLLVGVLYPVVSDVAVQAASDPYSVPNNVKNNWDNIRGYKHYNYTTSGRRIQYDVYPSKYTSGGYRIVNLNWTGERRPYINFQGYAIIQGHRHHTNSNNETYIVAMKHGSNETKIYSTLKLNISATNDFEFNDTGPGLQDPCPASARNKYSDDCNMRYDGVGFDAYLPIDDLFPDPTKKESWRLFLVKEVGERIVYTPLILPFEFDGLSHYGGEIMLSSGQNTSQLRMLTHNSLRRRYVSQTATSVRNELGDNRHFSEGQVYTRTAMNQSATVVWFGVRSTHTNDLDETKYAPSSYWEFMGDQATLTYTPDIDLVGESTTILNTKDEPQTTFDYGETVRVRGVVRAKSPIMEKVKHTHSLRKDSGSWSWQGNIREADYPEPGDARWVTKDYTDLRPGTYEVRAIADYDDQIKESNESNNQTPIAKFTIKDTIPPEHIEHEIIDHRYENGNDFWFQPNDIAKIRLRGRDVDSKLQHTFLRLDGSGVDARVSHSYDLNYGRADTFNYFSKSAHIDIHAAYKTYESSALREREATFETIAKTHGHNYDVLANHQDYAGNLSGYIDTEMNLRVDGIAPLQSKLEIKGERYRNDSNYWIRSNDKMTINIGQLDPDSGNKFQYLRARDLNDNLRIEARTRWDYNYNVHREQIAGNNLKITNVSQIAHNQQTGYGELLWEVQGNGHGNSFLLQKHLEDNVTNTNTYTTEGIGVIGIDDVAPTISFRNKSDTLDFTSRDWNNEAIEVRLKFQDPHSGYKRSRYAWTQSSTEPATNSSVWSSWNTSSNYVVTKEEAGEWYLHVETEDNVGNKRINSEGKYRYNTPPEVTMTYEPDPVYEGDTVNICLEPSDADGHKMNVILRISKNGGTYQVVIDESNVETGAKLCYDFIAEYPGEYDFETSVDDDIDTTTVENDFDTNPLGITGNVLHTEKWNEIHARLGTNNPEIEFYSGETFVLEGIIIDHPREQETVKVYFKGLQDNGNEPTATIDLERRNTTIFDGEYTEPAYMESGTALRSGSQAEFEFVLEYTNGLIKRDKKIVNIIGDVYDVFQIHRKY